MNTLQFIDSMTGRLAWPLGAVVLGLIFRASIAGLLERLKNVVVGDKRAEFRDITATASEMQQVMQNVAESLSDGEADQTAQQEQIEALAQVAANLGYRWAHRFPKLEEPPAIRVVWQDGQPFIDDRSDWRMRRITEPVVNIGDVSFTVSGPPRQ